MRRTLALLAALSLAACSPSSPKDTGATQGPASAEMSESSQSSMAIAAAVSNAAASSSDGTCLSEIGKAASDRLVARCIMVSPATHPPCNAANSCQMIQDEIDRSCAMYGPEEKKPAECAR
ncbi:hypothetical protein [Asticcacaulis sp.]|uniref:hypothetical protein n=1 Tax=Asticcacaulis sp. TaxID=1872648 RepID=UPI003F7C1965